MWALLRQESNVELGPITLAGSTTRRAVRLEVSVDGAGGTALGVMSQGELHALALALFLPRATAAGSPFRFLVIDDPVQSMDPAKVDGLARVLSETARNRQVVVFTRPVPQRRGGRAGRTGASGAAGRRSAARRRRRRDRADAGSVPARGAGLVRRPTPDGRRTRLPQPGLGSAGGRHLQVCNAAGHAPYPGALDDLVRDTRWLTVRVRDER